MATDHDTGHNQNRTSNFPHSGQGINLTGVAPEKLVHSQSFCKPFVTLGLFIETAPIGQWPHSIPEID